MSGSGFFITFEGGEGSGKTTQIARLATALRKDGHQVVTTREPGGSPGAEALRHVILSGAAEAFGPEMEAILFAAARADHVKSLILPALRRGAVVISDRFHDSSRVYQGVSGGLHPDFLRSLERVALGEVYPDLTLILDLDAESGLLRAAGRRGGDDPDRFEKEGFDVHEERREAFLAIAKAEPERCVIVGAKRDVDSVAAEIASIVRARLEGRNKHAESVADAAGARVAAEEHG